MKSIIPPQEEYLTMRTQCLAMLSLIVLASGCIQAANQPGLKFSTGACDREYPSLHSSGCRDPRHNLGE